MLSVDDGGGQGQMAYGVVRIACNVHEHTCGGSGFWRAKKALRMSACVPGLERLRRLGCIGEIRRDSRMKHKDAKNQEIVCIKPVEPNQDLRS